MSDQEIIETMSAVQIAQQQATHEDEENVEGEEDNVEGVGSTAKERRRKKKADKKKLAGNADEALKPGSEDEEEEENFEGMGSKSFEKGPRGRRGKGKKAESTAAQTQSQAQAQVQKDAFSSDEDEGAGKGKGGKKGKKASKKSWTAEPTVFDVQRAGGGAGGGGGDENDDGGKKSRKKAVHVVKKKMEDNVNGFKRSKPDKPVKAKEAFLEEYIREHANESPDANPDGSAQAYGSKTEERKVRRGDALKAWGKVDDESKEELCKGDEAVMEAYRIDYEKWEKEEARRVELHKAHRQR